MQTKKRLTPQTLFFVISIAGILGFFLYAFIVKSTDVFRWLVMEHNGDWEFADYFAHVFYGSDLSKTYNSFDVDPCFPPLAYLFYHFMYCINPNTAATGRTDIMNYSYNMFLFVLYTVLSAVLFVYAVQLYYQKNIANQQRLTEGYSGKSLLLAVVMLLSVPFGFSAIERGNSVFIVCTLLLLALIFRDSEKKWVRELALILIAIAANIKLYPAILGLLYLKEKRYKEAFRLVIYGGLLFVVPFVFFGGIEGIKDYLVIMYLMEGRSIEHLTTVRGVVTSLFMSVGGEAMKWTGHAVGKVVENIYLILALLGFFMSKNKWKSLLLLVSPMVIYVSSAYRYTTIYLFLALICFLVYLENTQETGSAASSILTGTASLRYETIKNYIYAALFGLLFTVPIWAIGFELENYMYLIVYLLIVFALVDVFAEWFRGIKLRKKEL